VSSTSKFAEELPGARLHSLRKNPTLQRHCRKSTASLKITGIAETNGIAENQPHCSKPAALRKINGIAENQRHH
jgi:hypothetical protein